MAEILVVDDDEALRHSFERLLRGWGYTCEGAGDAAAARAVLERSSFELVMLDINMPGESGISLLLHVRSRHPDAAVVMVTGEDDPNLAMRAIETGAYGYLIKPVRATQLLVTIGNALQRRSLEAQNQRAMERLQATVETRTIELVAALKNLEVSQTRIVASQTETIRRLARLVEFRDEETGQHVDRMSRFCAIIGRHLGLPEERCELLRLAAQLHDVGKVAVPDSILLKPGKLTDAEFEVMKGHAEAGHRMLADSDTELVRLGAEVAWVHHERWDGGGYPRGLAGHRISVEGRIAAVADVYDALTSRRPYRSAFASQTARDMLEAERGRHFDPEVLDAFTTAATEIEAARHTGNGVAP